jgi:hypothetical protein
MGRLKWRNDLYKFCKECKEKRVFIRDISNRNYCATVVLYKEADFMEQCAALTEVAEECGYKILYYPKYHCELNNVWGWLKQYNRKNEKYDYNKLKSTLNNTLLNVLQIDMVQRFQRRCFRYLSGYKLNLIGPELEFAVKVYKSHRRCPADLTNV